MTEAEWLAAQKPELMLKFVQEVASDRKLRLFAIACCRQVWPLLTDARSQRAVAIAERFTEQLASQAELDVSWQCGEVALQECIRDNAPHQHGLAYACLAARNSTVSCSHETARETAAAAARAAGWGFRNGSQDERYIADRKACERSQADALRDIFGDLFRSVTFVSAWRTSDVLLLARGIYEEHAFDRMPILADALQDAGCDSNELLNHLRDVSAAHVRGCWALDLVLEKE
jgi:hypothetical protein